MIDQELYALYVDVYSESSHFAAEDGGSRPGGQRRGVWRSSMERAIAEFARDDATNGTPMRTRAQFDRSLAEVPHLLLRLGMRDRVDAGCRPGGRGAALAWSG